MFLFEAKKVYIQKSTYTVKDKISTDQTKRKYSSISKKLDLILAELNLFNVIIILLVTIKSVYYKFSNQLLGCLCLQYKKSNFIHQILFIKY